MSGLDYVYFTARIFSLTVEWNARSVNVPCSSFQSPGARSRPLHTRILRLIGNHGMRFVGKQWNVWGNSRANLGFSSSHIELGPLLMEDIISHHCFVLQPGFAMLPGACATALLSALAMANSCTCTPISSLSDPAKSPMTGPHTCCRAGTPLLNREDDHAMMGFWSPKRPPKAPPSSPKLNCTYPILSREPCSSSQARALAYLNQQLQRGESEDLFVERHVENYDVSIRRFSWDTEQSWDDDCSAADYLGQRTSCADHDGATLVHIPSVACSSSSESDTVFGDSVDDTGPASARWKTSFNQNLGKVLRSSTGPIRRSNAQRPNFTQGSTLLNAYAPAKRTSCAAPSITGKAISAPMTRSTSIDPTVSMPSPLPDENRTQSWPGFASTTSCSDCASPMPLELLEKSSWDPDTSDEEKGGLDQVRQRGGRFRRKFERRLSNTLKPLLCRS